ncbi:MAG: AAA family ATPase, partial [Candidatus Melainabacteria bacterium]|nr:AAA family ATPase [Candidatus Melainabacteria bacterium]
DIDVRLSDIKGMEEAKAEAAEVVALLKNADAIRETGLKAPKGVLLIGRPGTGKTMLAKAIANEAGVPFYALSGGDFQSMWAGVGANRVRAVYEQARRSGKPAIVFIDEIDAIGAKRGIDLGGGAIQDSNKTLNQFLVELDGFGKHKVLTIGATNNPDMLDAALLRPGRFDRRIDVPLPNLEGREAILMHYLRKVKVDETVNALDIARMTVFSSGADLANIVNEAGLMSIRDGRAHVCQKDLIAAIQRVQFGMSYHRHVLVKELMATAYHEAGHAMVCYCRDRRDLIQAVTIVPSGSALGYVWPVAKEDYVQKNKHEYLVDIEVALGGYAAENLYMETTTSGVASDLTNVAAIASAMVRQWGMGHYKFNTQIAFGDGRSSPSAETEREIELQIKEIVDRCLQNVENLLRSRRAQLDRLAHKLIEKETLYYRDLVAILEPERPAAEVEREIMQLAERKLVGKPPVINLEAIGISKARPESNSEANSSMQSNNQNMLPPD